MNKLYKNSTIIISTLLILLSLSRFSLAQDSDILDPLNLNTKDTKITQQKKIIYSTRAIITFYNGRCYS